MTSKIKTEIIIILLIFILGFFLRFFNLAGFPVHLYWDEAAIAYNAFSILKTGADEWGKTMPLLFFSFGDNKLPLAIYLVSLSQFIFGATDFAVRLPSALFGSLTIIVTYFLGRELILFLPIKKNKRIIALLASLFLAISPWHLQFSRAMFEANVSLFNTSFAILLFLLAVRKNIKFLYLSIFFFALSFYTYHSAALSTPFLISVLFFLFRDKILQNKKTVVKAVILAFIIVLPYFPTYLDSVQARVQLTAESVISQQGSVIYNITNNLVANFSTDYLFFKGDQNGRHSVKTLGELYLWQLPALLAGLYFLLRFRNKASYILIFWIIFASLPPALTRVSPHALRSLLVIVPYQIICAIGLVFLLSKLPRWLSILTITPIFLYFLYLYLHIYYFHYPKAFAPDWQDGQRQTVEYLKRVEPKYRRIFLGGDLHYIYLLWYLKFDPKEIWAIKRQPDNSLKQFGKYLNKDVSKIAPKEHQSDKYLMVLPSWMGIDFPTGPITEIRATYGQPVFKIYEY